MLYDCDVAASFALYTLSVRQISVYVCKRERERERANEPTERFAEAAALLHVRVCCCLAATRSTTESQSTCASSAGKSTQRNTQTQLCFASLWDSWKEHVSSGAFLSVFRWELTSLLASFVASVRGSNNISSFTFKAFSMRAGFSWCCCWCWCCIAQKGFLLPLQLGFSTSLLWRWRWR